MSACGTRGTRGTGAPTGLRTIRYGSEHRDQYGVLGMPSGTPRALVLLLHGGFWQDGYGAELMDPLAADLRARGFATWNVEYRRVGGAGGFPATFLDVAAAVDKVDSLGLGSAPTILLGHSAGGHLAVWAASRTAGTPGGAPRVVPSTTISLSGVLDLGTAATQVLGGGAAGSLMGAGPDRAPNDYAVADPIRLVPARGTVIAVHARADDVVPLDQSRAYVAADQAAGGDARLVLLPGDHFALIDPGSDAWAEVVALL